MFGRRKEDVRVAKVNQLVARCVESCNPYRQKQNGKQKNGK